MAKSKLIDRSEYEVIANNYLSGDSSVEIGKQYGVSASTIGRILKNQGIATRKKGGYHTALDSQNRTDLILDLYKSGLCITQIAKEMRVCPSTVSEKIANLGVRATAKKSKILKEYNPEKIIFLYKFGFNISEVASKERVSNRTVSRIIQENNLMRLHGWKQSKKARILADQRLGLYRQGMTFSEIDDYLSDRPGACRHSLSRYYPTEIKNNARHERIANKRRLKEWRGET